MEVLKEIAGLAREQGPAFAGWVLLLAAVAWISGAGAKAAINNVRSLLLMNERMRQSLADQLDKSTEGRDEAERANARLRADLTSANRRMAELEGRLEFAERRAQTLETELSATMAENQRLRRTSH